MKIDLDLPMVFSVDDYHEFDYFQDFVQKMSCKIKIKEVTFGLGVYWGIAYCGRKPSQKITTQLLSNAGYNKRDDE